MRWLSAATFLVLALCTHASAAEPSKDWRLVARADVIAVATLTVPKKNGSHIAGKDDWARVEIHPVRVLKGELSPGLAIRQYLGEQTHQVDQQTLLALGNQPVMVFLILSTDGAYNPVLYFENEYGLESALSTRITAIDAEIARQNEVLTQWKSDATLKDFAVVRILIDKTTTKSSATQAYKDLEALGHEGVSAIIAQMDDRRDLGVKQIELVNPPNFWEGIRHYGPEKVVDVLSAILNQITAEDFGFIENGGTEEERKHAVTGWRIYDDVLRNHTAVLKN